MVNIKICFVVFLLITLPGLFQTVDAQFIKDLSRQIEVSNISNLNGTETHLYVLSETEGLVVFRAYSDSLQWLYTSQGMQERGNRLDSDIRFAYLFGDNRRLTVVEPTSVLGVYSSTVLPSKPLSVKRIGLRLFVALGNTGLGYVNLESPETVDSDLSFFEDVNSALDLASDGLQSLYVLGRNNTLHVIDVNDESVSHRESVTIKRDTEKIFLVENELIGTSNNGDLFFINSDGVTQLISNVKNSVERISEWNDLFVVRTESGSLWYGDSGNLEVWKTRGDSGNFLASTGATLWLAEFNTVAPLLLPGQSSIPGRDSNMLSEGEEFKLKNIDDIIMPYPRPLIIPIEFVSDVNVSQVSFSYQASFQNARIRGNSFYWQPTSSQTGRHQITITAALADGRTDSTSFTADIRSFNSPPRFTPARPITIPVGEEFELTITAVDSDGPNPNLIRYLGVDMPEGATLVESTGLFSWTPNIRQVGKHTFQIIATDQFGAASAQNFEINVIEIDIDDEIEEDLF